jgi:hypothetical protein
MSAPAKSSDPAPNAGSAAGISTGMLLDMLAAHPEKRLVFSADDREIRPGYHVTEVKDGRFSALDCGANPESWRETFVQLWDVAENPERGHMGVGKFLAIMRKVAEHVPFDPNAKLTFEVSDGEAAIRLFKATSIDVSEKGKLVRVALVRSPSSCKPRDRWLEQKQQTPCCGTTASAQSCCSAA